MASQQPVHLCCRCNACRTQVHSAWYGAGVAPALHSALPVGGSAFIMVVMELLAEEDSWVPLRKALARGGGEPLKQAVRSALEAAHAAHVPEDNAVAAHGDVCCDNTFVRGRGGSASGEYDVRFTGFEWCVASSFLVERECCGRRAC